MKKMYNGEEVGPFKLTTLVSGDCSGKALAGTLSRFNKVAKSNPTQLDVKLRANVTPQAEIMIEINKSVGDVIKANGNGLINIDINPEKDIFDIFGDFNTH